MFFRNEKTRARAGFPLQRLFQLLRGAIELERDRRLRSGFRRNRRRSDKAIVELNGAPPNGDGANEKENRRSHQHRAIVIRLKPVDCFRHIQKRRTTDYTDFTDRTRTKSMSVISSPSTSLRVNSAWSRMER